MRKLNLIFTAAICGLAMMACKNGGSNAAKVDSNPYLGNIPALYAAYEADVQALEQKERELGDKFVDKSDGSLKNTDASKLASLVQELKATEKAQEEKMEADIKAETQKLSGTEIPVTYSEALKNSDEWIYDVVDPKLVPENSGEPRILCQFNARKELQIPASFWETKEYTAYYRMVGTDAATLYAAEIVFIRADTKNELKFTAGQPIKERTFPLRVDRNPAAFAGFTGIEFITAQEYKVYNQ